MKILILMKLMLIKSVLAVSLNSDLNTIKTELKSNDLNVTKINLNKDVQITITDNDVQIQLNTIDKNVLLVTPSNSIILNKFNKLTFTINNLYSNKDKGKKSKIDNKNDHLLLAGSKKFQNWINSIDLSFVTNFYIFNITNPNDILNGLKPNVSEIGPFIFDQKRYFQIDGWQDNEKYVNLKQFKNYSSLEGFRKLKPQNVTTLNIPLIVCKLKTFLKIS